MTLNITVIGCGYLGITHAASLAHLGFDVLGLDVSAERVDMLNQGIAPIYEPVLGSLLKQHAVGADESTRRLRFTTSYQRVADFGDVHFLCTGTPQTPEGACDLSQVHSAVDALAPLLRHPCLLVGKSTVPVGTAEHLAHRVAELAPVGRQAELAWNPEFLREGRAVQDTLHPERIVVGATSEQAEKQLREVYAWPIDNGTPFLVCDLATAELVKVSANAFLATKISFINAMAEVCEAAGADVVKLSEALGHDDRIGSKFLNAGLGFGGGCLPKDLRAFLHRGEELGVSEALGFLHDVEATNNRARRRMVEMTRDTLGGTFPGKKVGILGATFKPGTDDVRDSPALDVGYRLHRRGAHVVLCDPHGIHNAARAAPEMEYTEDVENAVREADVVLHLTEWNDFRSLDPEVLGKLAAQKNLIDGRNVLDLELWREAGWTVKALGRPRL